MGYLIGRVMRCCDYSMARELLSVSETQKETQHKRCLREKASSFGLVWGFAPPELQMPFPEVTTEIVYENAEATLWDSTSKAFKRRGLPLNPDLIMCHLIGEAVSSIRS